MHLKCDKLVINRQMYVWDKLSNQRRKLTIADGGQTRNGTIKPSGSARDWLGSQRKGVGVAST